MSESRVDSVSVRGLSKRFGRQRALSDLSLNLSAGQVIVLLGPNGAGKSTLLGILSTLVRPTAGKVLYQTKSLDNVEGESLRRQIGVLSHEALLYSGLTGLENLCFFGALYEVENLEDKVRKRLEEVGLDEEASTRPVSGYSRGMLQRLSLARALLHDPRIILLDEPFTGLDRKGMEALSKSIDQSKQEERLQIVVTHDFQPLDGLADHLVVLRRGKLAHEVESTSGFSTAELKELYHQHTD